MVQTGPEKNANMSRRLVIKEKDRILFVGHDASRTGAPIVLLQLLRWLKTNTDLHFGVLLGHGGPLVDEYRSLAPTWVVSDVVEQSQGLFPYLDRVPGLKRWRRALRAAALRQELRLIKPDLVYTNTIASLLAVEVVAPLRLPMVLHVHELEMCIRLYAGIEAFNVLKGLSDRYVAVSEAVRQNLVEKHGISPERIEMAYEFVDTNRKPSDPRDARRRRLCLELGLDPDAPVDFVGAVGTLDWRKGADLIVPLAMRMSPRGGSDQQIHFLWLGGNPGSPEAVRLRYDAQQAGVADRVHVLGSRPNPADYIDLFDVFVLTSREDPYPLAVLEAAALGKPIVCFAGGGGAPEFVTADAGFVVPYLDINSMADRVETLLRDPDLCSRMGAQAQAKVRRQHDLNVGAARILELIRSSLDSATVRSNPVAGSVS